MYLVCRFFLYFLFYSFCGWAYETILCSVQEKKLVNRGFLQGPLCPIYGVGAVAVILCLSPLRHDLLLLFFASMLLTGCIEYFTGYLLETLFHAKWWDYSHFRFQLKGRVCLLGLLAFGTFSVVLLTGIHPWVERVVGAMPRYLIYTLGGFFFGIFVVDIAFTVASILRLNSKLKEMQAAITGFVEEQLHKVDDARQGLVARFVESDFYTQRIQLLMEKKDKYLMRIIRSLPRFQSLRYDDALNAAKTFWGKFLDQGKREKKKK